MWLYLKIGSHMDSFWHDYSHLSCSHHDFPRVTIVTIKMQSHENGMWSFTTKSRCQECAWHYDISLGWTRYSQPDEVTFILTNIEASTSDSNCRYSTGLAVTQEHTSVSKSPNKWHSGQPWICLPLFFWPHSNLGQETQIVPDPVVRQPGDWRNGSG
jgi:hypothetical protein